jgi:hypothetical protein
MKIHSLVILFIVFLFLVGAFYGNRLLQKMIQPRKSFGRLGIYFISAFALIFAFVFLLVWIVGHLFPPGK